MYTLLHYVFFDLTILSSKVNGLFNDPINHDIATYPVTLCERIDGDKYQEWVHPKKSKKTCIFVSDHVHRHLLLESEFN